MLACMCDTMRMHGEGTTHVDASGPFRPLQGREYTSVLMRLAVQVMVPTACEMLAGSGKGMQTSMQVAPGCNG